MVGAAVLVVVEDSKGEAVAEGAEVVAAALNRVVVHKVGGPMRR